MSRHLLPRLRFPSEPLAVLGLFVCGGYFSSWGPDWGPGVGGNSPNGGRLGCVLAWAVYILIPKRHGTGKITETLGPSPPARLQLAVGVGMQLGLTGLVCVLTCNAGLHAHLYQPHGHLQLWSRTEAEV